jgi:hypothetical protein
MNAFFAQGGKERASMAYENMRVLVTNGNFSFEADSATPVSGHSISMATNSNHLMFKKDSIEGYLPYFGEVTSGVSYSGHGAILFNSKPIKYKVRYNDSKNGLPSCLVPMENQICMMARLKLMQVVMPI